MTREARKISPQKNWSFLHQVFTVEGKKAVINLLLSQHFLSNKMFKHESSVIKLSFVLRKVFQRGLVLNFVSQSRLLQSKIQPWEQSCRELRAVLKIKENFENYNFQGKQRQRYCSTIILNMVTDVKQLLAFIGGYFKRLLVKFRKDLASFKSIQALVSKGFFPGAFQEVHTTLDPQAQMMNFLECHNFRIFGISKFLLIRTQTYKGDLVVPTFLFHFWILKKGRF